MRPSKKRNRYQSHLNNFIETRLQIHRRKKTITHDPQEEEKKRRDVRPWGQEDNEAIIQIKKRGLDEYDCAEFINFMHPERTA